MYKIKKVNPFEDDNNSLLLNNILTANVIYSDIVSEKLLELLKKIFVVNPKSRISIDDIKVDPWFEVDYAPVKGEIDKEEGKIQIIEDDSTEMFSIEKVLADKTLSWFKNY